jgi:hypothetical protein
MWIEQGWGRESHASPHSQATSPSVLHHIVSLLISIHITARERLNVSRASQCRGTTIETPTCAPFPPAQALRMSSASPRSIPATEPRARSRAKKACKVCNARRIRCNVMEEQPCKNCKSSSVPCELIQSRRGKWARPYPFGMSRC